MAPRSTLQLTHAPTVRKPVLLLLTLRFPPGPHSDFPVCSGPDMMVEPYVSESLDTATAHRLAVPIPSVVESMSTEDLSLEGLEASPRTIPPPPNPHFVFPARPSSYSAPSSFSRATGRRPRSTIEPPDPIVVIASDNEKSRPRSPALPAFSFNPGASLPSPAIAENSFLSPPQSPAVPESPRTIPARIGTGHRRGGSEFVGGTIRAGDTITVLSTSPTKSESGMASPLLQPTKPNRPRGHAHRRSAAISSHDLSSIILPSPHQNLRGSSAPASPALLDRSNGCEFPAPEPSPALSEANRSRILESSYVNTDEIALGSVTETEQPSKPPTRNRVGFSDTLEFIPRPLSLVSSDTSSTATARPGHSVSGSISSVISITNVEREHNSPLGFSPARKRNETRPSTAGAILERTQSISETEPPLSSPRRRGSIPFLGALPPPTAVAPPTPSPTKSVKKWSFFGLDPFVAGSPTRSRPVSASSTESQGKPASSPNSSCAQIYVQPADETADEADDLKPITKKRSKKQKKVKTWAGSILSRKPKPRHGKQKRRTPTPPPLSHATFRRDGEMSECFMEMSPEPEPAMPTFMVSELSANGREEAWTTSSLPDEDSSYPMIDLDAALGPFNTPLPRNPEWEAAQRAGGHLKKQLHSAAGMSRFTGPGMHYQHRRAESAPEMVPFEAGRLGFPRFGSSSTMADVFEEDEEEDHDSAAKSTGQSTPVGETPVIEKALVAVIPDNDNAGLADITVSKSPILDDSKITEAEPRAVVSSNNEQPFGTPNMKFDRSTSSLHDGIVPVDLFNRDFTSVPREASIGNDSLDSATPSPRHIHRPKELAPVDVSPLNLPVASLAPISPYSMTQSSSFPSPRSPISYDAHRISTAPSSITEDNFQSLLMGEPGPEVRISVDDIPSLTSSNSTMTRDSIFAQHPQARHPPLSDQPRPASFTSTAFGRRRSSLASLSRLISSSHGERSKLSMEVSMDSEPERKAKISKAKRLSRMMQFWKSKEAEGA
ncbi:hypothetical protein B0H67DRAFT_597346 [Lasiosphaeris hirsuta]|uniref:Cell wall proline rich protein n=1 Tax=Lasiosphaeris hirsuta TaxID=260670 RepID=A0AA40BBY5_9PEZI|nr:hypothetical protein B0H67DRAFT_597346 [Lasiosphaeris hirsuta]